MNFKILFVLLLTLHSVQAKASFDTATECHNCQDEQYAQRAVSQGEGFHFLLNFGDNPGIRYFHVQNVLLGADPIERRLAERGHTYVLGAIPLPVPAEAEAQFKMIKEAIDLSKNVTHLEIPPGTDLDPGYNLSSEHRLDNPAVGPRGPSSPGGGDIGTAIGALGTATALGDIRTVDAPPLTGAPVGIRPGDVGIPLAKAAFNVTECHDCQDEQYVQRAVSQGEGYHYVLNFGDNPGIRYFHVQNILLGADPIERRLAERGYTYILGAIPMPVPAEAEAQFTIIKEAIDLSKGVTNMEIPPGTDLDPGYNMSSGYRLDNIMQLAPQSERARFLGRLGTYLNGLRSLSPHGIAFMRARGHFGAYFSVGGITRGIAISLAASYKPYPELIVTVSDQYGGRVDVKYNPGAQNGMILDVRGGDGERLHLDIIYGMVLNKVDFDLRVGLTAEAAEAYAETLRKTFQLPSEFVPRHGGGSGRLVCGDVALNGQARYTCYPGD